MNLCWWNDDWLLIVQSAFLFQSCHTFKWWYFCMCNWTKTLRAGYLYLHLFQECSLHKPPFPMFMHLELLASPSNMGSFSQAAAVPRLISLHCSKSSLSVCLIFEIFHVSSKNFRSVDLFLNQLHPWETVLVWSLKKQLIKFLHTSHAQHYIHRLFPSMEGNKTFATRPQISWKF